MILSDCNFLAFKLLLSFVILCGKIERCIDKSGATKRNGRRGRRYNDAEEGGKMREKVKERRRKQKAVRNERNRNKKMSKRRRAKTYDLAKCYQCLITDYSRSESHSLVTAECKF